MPRIREYTQQFGAQGEIPGRRAGIADFTSATGNSGKAVSDAGEQIYKLAEEQEVSDTYARLAKARADWTVALQERAQGAEAGDPNFAQKFTDDFSDYLGKMAGTQQTRAGAQAFQRGSAELAAHFTQSAGVYQAQIAGAKAAADVRTALDLNRNTLLGDPTQFESILKSSDEQLAAARVDPKTRLELQKQVTQELALSAAQGVIRLNPSMGLDQVQKGRWAKYLDADKSVALEASAKAAVSAEREEKERVRIADERAERKAVEAETADLFAKITLADAGKGEMPSLKDILYNPVVKNHPENTRFLIAARKAATTQEPGDEKAYGVKFIGLLKEVHDGTLTDPNTLVAALEGKDITYNGFRQLTTEILGKRTQEGATREASWATIAASARAAIDKTVLGFPDSKGPVLYQQWYNDKRVEWDAAVRDGTWRELVDKKNPKYLLREIEENSPTYMRPLSQIFADTMGRLGSAGPVAPANSNALTPKPDDSKRRPGESVEQFRARTAK